MNKATLSVLSVTMAATVTLLPRAAHSETSFGVSTMAEARAMYEHDEAACKSGAVDEDRRTCLIEARRAYEQAKRELQMQKQHRKTHDKDSSKQ
jgi:hypothetical protein